MSKQSISYSGEEEVLCEVLDGEATGRWFLSNCDGDQLEISEDLAYKICDIFDN